MILGCLEAKASCYVRVEGVRPPAIVARRRLAIGKEKAPW